MSGATKEIGAPESRINEFQRNFVLTPRGNGSRSRYLDWWSPLATSLRREMTKVNAAAGPRSLVIE
jgi:hypothetical protein